MMTVDAIQKELLLLEEIAGLKEQLSEYQELVEAIKSGAVDALAITKDGKSDVYTLESTDFVYRILVENFGESALNVSDTGTIVYANGAFENLIDMPNSAIIGKDISSLIDTNSKKEFKQLFSKAFSGRSRGEITLSLKNKRIPVYISLSSLYPKYQGVGIIITDLTEKKRTEEAILNYQSEIEKFLRAEIVQKQKTEDKNKELEGTKSFLTQVIDSSVEFIIVLDSDLKFITVNSRYENIMQLSREQIIGKRLFEINPAAENTIHHECILKALNGEAVHLEKLEAISAQKMYLDTHFVPYMIDGKVKGVLIMSRDVTNIVKYEKALELKNAELEKSNHELESFNYIASHDLQEPLRKIQTFTGMIEELDKKNLSDKSLSYFQKIDSSAARMQMLIKSLVQYSRVSLTKPAFEETDLNVLVKEVVEEIRDFEKIDACFKIDELPLVNVIPLQFKQLFSNLFHNSIKYRNPDHTPEITISCKQIKKAAVNNSAKTHYWQINVTDNGIGFDMEYSNKIFDLFQRLHDKVAYEGTGIGLAICKKIVENHDGFIGAVSKPNGGATFEILIPWLK